VIFLLGTKFPEVKSEQTKILVASPWPTLLILWFLRYGIVRMPQSVVINAKGVRYAGRWIGRKQIAAISVETLSPTRSYLCLEKTPCVRHPKNHWLAKLITIEAARTVTRIGISAKVATRELAEFIQNEFQEIKAGQ
jgi:hypothetical protein